jgi:CheY-like chemotaxis protein
VTLVEERKNLVLFVDDEPHILAAIRRAVDDEPFTALFAGSAKEALSIVEQRSLSVIVTDMRMPVMDGLALLKIVREKSPRTVRMVLSGYTQLSQVLATINQGEIFQFISKPWEMEEELLRPVRQAIERYNLEEERDSLREGLAQKNQAYRQIFRVMEQKLNNEKRDLASLKQINHWMFAFWKKHLAMCNGPVDSKIDAAHGQVDLIEEILLMYMDILPTVFEGRNIEQAIAGITKSCNGRVVIAGEQDASLVLFGYYSFLAMVFKLLVYLLTPNTTEVVSFGVSVEPKSSGFFFVVFDCVSLKTADQTRLKIGCSMLSEIGKAYRLRIIPQSGPDGIETIRVVWQAMLDMNGTNQGKETNGNE